MTYGDRADPATGSRASGARCDRLLEQACLGDREAYGAFVDLTAGAAGALARSLGVIEPESVLVDCYVRAWRDLDDYVHQELSSTTWSLARLQGSIRSTPRRPSDVLRHEPARQEDDL